MTHDYLYCLQIDNLEASKPEKLQLVILVPETDDEGIYKHSSQQLDTSGTWVNLVHIYAKMVGQY